MSTIRNIGTMRKAYDLHKSLMLSQRVLVRERGAYAGIAVSDDELAIKWQSLELKIYVLDQWIMGDPMDIDYVISLINQ